jgi:hypothetical protein
MILELMQRITTLKAIVLDVKLVFTVNRQQENVTFVIVGLGQTS